MRLFGQFRKLVVRTRVLNKRCRVTCRCHTRDGHIRRTIEDNSGRIRLWPNLSSEEAP